MLRSTLQDYMELYGKYKRGQRVYIPNMKIGEVEDHLLNYYLCGYRSCRYVLELMKVVMGNNFIAQSHCGTKFEKTHDVGAWTGPIWWNSDTANVDNLSWVLKHWVYAKVDRRRGEAAKKRAEHLHTKKAKRDGAFKEQDPHDAHNDSLGLKLLTQQPNSGTSGDSYRN